MTPYERFRPSFAKLLDERKWPLAWLDEEVASGRATAMGDERACIVATLRRYPGGLVEVHGLCAAGDLRAIKHWIGEAEAWGMAHGAGLASIASRRGWARALPEYAETQVTIEKELPDGS